MGDIEYKQIIVDNENKITRIENARKITEDRLLKYNYIEKENNILNEKLNEKDNSINNN